MAEDTPQKVTPEDRALRRVRALLDKAENSATTEPEREAAMATAMQLMADYGINEAMANARGQIREKVTSKNVQLGNPYSYDKNNLLSWLCHELNCTVIIHQVGNTYTGATVFGYESDVARLEMLYTSLLLQAMRQIRTVRPNWSYPTSAETRQYRQNWFHGFNVRVSLRVRENEEQAARKFEREHADETRGTALVVADRKAQVVARMEEVFPPAKLSKFRKRDRDGDGLTEGARAGDRADIGNGKVESGDQRKIGSGHA